jgi:hypothetical protein
VASGPYLWWAVCQSHYQVLATHYWEWQLAHSTVYPSSEITSLISSSEILDAS